MKHVYSAVVSIGLSLLPLGLWPARAQTFTPAPQQSFHVDVVATAGHANSWTHKDLGALNALRGTVRIGKLLPHPKWASTFSVMLESEDDKFVMLTFAPSNSSGKIRAPIQIVLEFGTSSKKFNKTLEIDEKLDFELFWADGTVRARLGNSETQELTIPWQPVSASVAAGSGEIIVDPLFFGTGR